MLAELLVTQRALHEVQLRPGEELILTVWRPSKSSFSSVEVVNLDGGGRIYFRWGATARVAGNMSDVFPAAIGSVVIPIPGYGLQPDPPTATLHLISAGSPVLSFIRR